MVDYSPQLQTTFYPIPGPYQAKGFSPFSSSPSLLLLSLYRFLSHSVCLMLIFGHPPPSLSVTLSLLPLSVDILVL